MPEFKLKQMFGRGQSPKKSPSHRQTDTASVDVGRTMERSQSPNTTGSPEHCGHSMPSAGSGPRLSLSGSSLSGGGSKSSSLERQGHRDSDGGISSMSGSGTDDSGHSSMTSPLNLPMEQLQSFNAVYRAGQSRYASNPYQLNVQGPPKNISKQQMHQILAGSGHNRHGFSKSTKGLTLATAVSPVWHDARKEDDYNDDVFMSDHPPDKSYHRKQPNLGFDYKSSRYIDLSLDPTLSQEDLYAGTSENASVPKTCSVDTGEEIGCMSLHTYESDTSHEDYRNKIIFELQWQVSELHERCAQLQKEADLARDRLGSSMHSVTTFWSPELKKERSLRKEEASRCNKLYEHLLVRRAELKQQHEALKCKEQGGKTDDVQQTPTDADSSGDMKLLQTPEPQCFVAEISGDMKRVQTPETQRSILQERVEELEKNLQMQTQTLSARDASIKTLLDMLQGKRRNGDGEQDEQARLETQAAINSSRICELQVTLQAKDAHISKLKKLKYVVTGQPQLTGATHPLNAIIEAKDCQIRSLEKEVSVLEEKLLRAEEDVILGSYRDLGPEESPAATAKQLHHQIQKAREEVSHGERKVSSAKRHVDNLQWQHEQSLQQLSVLKEQFCDKEHQATALMSEVEGLQERLKNKDGTIERKRTENQALIADKQSLEAEVADLKDQLDTRQHLITVLKRKAEMYDDVLKEKDEQLYQARSQHTPVQTIDSPVFSPEQAIAERERQIERLHQLQNQSDRDHEEELELYVMTSQDLQTQMAAMQFELTAKQAELQELREEARKLRAQKQQKVTLMTEQQSALVVVSREQVSTQTQTDAGTPCPEMWSSTDESLSGTAEWGSTEAVAGVSLLEELQKKVADMEQERADRQRHIQDLQDIIKEYREKVGTLKRNQQKEKEKNAQLLEAAKKRENSFSDDASHLSTAIEQKQARIGELEEALRESVRITAQREVDMMELQAQIEASKLAMEEMRQEVEEMGASSRDYNSKLATLSRQLDDKDVKIRRLAAQQHSHIQELYEIKQEAVQAAIGEKEASIAVLEMSGVNKPHQQHHIHMLKLEKHRLQAALTDVTQSLARLRAGCKRGSGSTSDCTAAGSENRGSVGKKNYKDGSTTI